jgi:hypothetical protein
MMSNFNNQWIEIFRAGDYGEKGNWTPEKLAAVVSNFKSGAWKPPAVLGHPKNDSPAMGWVEDLALEGAVLKAKFEKVQPQLEAHVAEGRFPNRSAAFYMDPQGNGPMLRHVGFLGATPPEVKGLEAIKFSDGEFIAIDFKEEEEAMDANEIKKTVTTEIRDFFKNLFAEKRNEPAAFTEEEVQKRIDAANKPLLEAMSKLSTQFEESVKKANETSAATTAAAKLASVADFIKARKAANQWVPAFSEAGLEKVLEHLAVAGGTVKFGEAGKEKESSALDVVKTFLEKLPAIVPLRELATMGAEHAENLKPHLVAKKAMDYQAEQGTKGVTVGAAEAVAHVMGK